MGNFGTENTVVILVLLALICVYVYLLVSPSQPRVSPRPRNFVLSRNTKADFEDFVREMNELGNFSSWKGYSFGSGSSKNYTFDDYEWNEFENYTSQGDDFFLEPNEFKQRSSSESSMALIPSSKYICANGWISIRSELNYKYLWLHGNTDMWLSATATLDTPLQRKTFQVVPVIPDCKLENESDVGWIRLREEDTQGFLHMVIPSDTFQVDEWVVKLGSSDLTETANDTRYHFLLEEAGFIMNRGGGAFLNVMSQAEYGIRGHTSTWDRSRPAGREYSATMHFVFVNESDVQASVSKEQAEIKEAKEQDEELLKVIQKFPVSKEKRVISFGLYGTKDKYTLGAVKNAELAKVYFPGWICRYYVTSDVPASIISRLKELGSEIEEVPTGMGYASGMFWRFMVGADETVDRYLVRDVDSRLNARDRIAVEEWVNSKYEIHILRDHVNHCLPMNGGMWGGVKGAIPHLKDMILGWNKRDEYSADLHFLEEKIWPTIKMSQMSHDSYCCDRYPNTRPFPTRRSPTYQHVGQVFDSEDHPRYVDIDGYIRGVPIPSSCRKDASWIYG